MNRGPNEFIGTQEVSEDHSVNFDLPLAGFEGTPREIERQWFEQIYKGRGDSMAQLTWRAVLMGTALGGILSLTNLYIGLKTGFNFGVAITASILSYAIWTGLYRLHIARTRMSILENNCMQSTASSAGYSTGGTLFSAFAAYIILNGTALPFYLTLAWVFFIALLGVTMAVPMKRQMINIDQLRFPSGIAAAETLRALHSHGQKGMRAAKALGIAGLLAAVDKFWSEGLTLISANLEKFTNLSLFTRFQVWLLGNDSYNLWKGRTITFAWDSVWIGAGAIAGMRACASVIVSATLCWGVFVPILENQGLLPEMGFRNVVQWTLWGGSSCMVVSGLFGIFTQWQTAVDALRSVRKMFSRKPREPLTEIEAIETPTSWFIIGQLVSLIALAWLAHVSFDMPWWQSALAVALSYPLSLVACRVTGETDFTPNGAMGKVTQLTFGVLNPGNINVNLMSANITTGAAGSAADLLTDLKSGYLLGAHPRKQFIAQFAGIFIGTVVTVLVFSVLVTKPSDLGGNQFPAPAALVWSAVARALSNGLAALHPIKVRSIFIGAAVGLILSLLPILFPKRRNLFPSGSAVGLGWYLPWFNSFLFFLGALANYIVQKKAPKHAEEFSFPVASGVIAGGSLMGIALIFWANGADILKILTNLLSGK
ncbi:MAG TPA: OPT family oligopeptide transporter [Chthoniobacteraceae bacterium]|nr:OPT family oligopeptide transporter [Chthoniobacteraceae bacterium]